MGRARGKGLAGSVEGVHLLGWEEGRKFAPTEQLPPSWSLCVILSHNNPLRQVMVEFLFLKLKKKKKERRPEHRS